MVDILTSSHDGAGPARAVTLLVFLSRCQTCCRIVVVFEIRARLL